MSELFWFLFGVAAGSALTIGAALILIGRIAGEPVIEIDLDGKPGFKWPDGWA